MKRVLIVDDERLFLASLKEGLSLYSHEFEVLIANDGKQAINILTAEVIDLLLTDLNMPVMDGFELLTYTMKFHPNLPVLVMTAFGTPEIEDQLQNLEVIGYLEKPLDFQILTDKIRSTLAQSAKGNIKGITLSSFLQLLEIENKTCLLKVTSDSKVGFLYFISGKLVDAIYENYEAEEAADLIVCWENVEIEISDLVKKVQKRISKSLSNLLMEAAQLKDEKCKDDQLTESEMFSVSISEDEEELWEQSITEEKSNLVLKEKFMGNINDCLNELMKVDGAMAASLTDSKSGMALGMVGGGLNLEIAAAGNSEVVRAKIKTMQTLNLKDKIEDILITLGGQYHLIRPLNASPALFLYYVLNKSQANLALARHKLAEVESRIEV